MQNIERSGTLPVIPKSVILKHMKYLRRFLFLLIVLFAVVSCETEYPVDNISAGDIDTTSKEVTNFSLSVDGKNIAGTIDQNAKTINLTVPAGTDKTKLPITLTHNGAFAKIGDITIASGKTTTNFSNPVTMTITAINGTTQDYTITVTG